MESVTANGLRFGYLEQGKGPLAVLLHGFPDTAYTWDATLAALAGAGYRAVAPFMRGYHPTEIPTGDAFDIDTLGRDALGLIEALGETSAIVVGHDWGASAAYAAAILGPERVRAVITLAIPHSAAIKPSPALAWRLRQFITLGRRNAPARVRKDNFAMVDELVQRWSPAWHVPAGETDPVKAAFREPGCVEAAVGYYRVAKLRPTGAMLRPVTVPAVAFAGDTDYIFKPRAFEKARHWFTGSYQVVRMPGGHFLHREHPDLFTRELLRVVHDHEARAGITAAPSSAGQP